MATAIAPLVSQPVRYPQTPPAPNLLPRNLKAAPRDTVAFGQGGALSPGQANSIVLERAYDKLRGIVADARAALGIPEDAALDTSNEATAGRIVEFALGMFEKFRSNPSRAGLSNEDARKEFVSFIGDAIGKGIEEARGILGALKVLNPEIDNNINTISGLIAKRLEEFAANGK